MFQHSTSRYTMPRKQSSTTPKLGAASGGTPRDPVETDVVPDPTATPKKAKRLSKATNAARLRKRFKDADVGMDALVNARQQAIAGELSGCYCYQLLSDEERRKPLPFCDHVWDYATTELASNANPINPRGFRASTEPLKPTNAEPGSEEKILLLRERIRQGMSVDCPGDKIDTRPTRLPKDEEENFNDEDD